MSGAASWQNSNRTYKKEFFDPDGLRIENVIREITKGMPDEEWEKLPHDVTDRLDCYLYCAEDW